MLTGESLGRSRKSLAVDALKAKASWNPELLFPKDVLTGENSALAAFCISMLALVRRLCCEFFFFAVLIVVCLCSGSCEASVCH